MERGFLNTRADDSGNVELIVYNYDGSPRVTTKDAWRDVPLTDWTAQVNDAFRLSELTAWLSSTRTLAKPSSCR